MKKLTVRNVLSGMAVFIGLTGCVVYSRMGMSLFDSMASFFLFLFVVGALSFFSVKAACYGALYCVSFLWGTVENDWLDSPQGGFFKFAVLMAVTIGMDDFIKWLKKRAPDSGKEKPEEDWHIPDRELREAIKNAPANSLLVKSFGDALYQLYRGANRLYVIRLGSVIEPECGQEIQSEEAFVPSRKNGQIDLEDILEVRINPGRSFNPWLKIRARGRTRRFQFLEYTKREEIDRFFSGLPVREVKTGLRSHENLPEPTEEQARRFEPYRKISVSLAYAGVLCAALWLFTDTAYKLFEALNLALPVIAFLVYCAYFEAIQPMKPEKRLDYATWSCLIPATALTVRCLFDFHLDDPLLAALPAAILALIAAAVFAAFMLGKKPELNRVLAVFFVIIGFSVLAVFHVNFLLDDGAQATYKDTTVSHKEIDRDNLMPTRFGLYLSGANGDIYHVPRAFYDTLKEEDTVTLVQRTGALGIPYSFVVPIGSSGDTWSP